MSATPQPKRLRVQYRKTASLEPYDCNPRTHSEDQIAQIAASIEEFGWTNPILVDGTDGVVAGHGRLLAAQRLGLAQVPVIELAGLSEAHRRAYVIQDPARDSQFRTDTMIAATEPGIAGGDEIEQPAPPFAKARTVREHFRALRERLEYEHLVGKLVVVQEVEDAGHEAGLMVREVFEASAERIGEAIAVQLR